MDVSPQQALGYGISCIMSRTFWTEPVRRIAKIRLKYRLNNQLDRHLHYPIPDGRDTKWPFTPIRFGNPYPAYCLGMVVFTFQFFLQFPQKIFLPFSFLYALKTHTVNTRRSFI